MHAGKDVGTHPFGGEKVEDRGAARPIAEQPDIRRIPLEEHAQNGHLELVVVRNENDEGR